MSRSRLFKRLIICYDSALCFDYHHVKRQVEFTETVYPQPVNSSSDTTQVNYIRFDTMNKCHRYLQIGITGKQLFHRDVYPYMYNYCNV